jgi:hypothetical protein
MIKVFLRALAKQSSKSALEINPGYTIIFLMMTMVLPLSLRKKNIDALPPVDVAAARGYGLRRQEYMLDFFRANPDARKNVLNWKKLDLGNRVKHIIARVKHALRFNGRNNDDVKVRVLPNDAATKNTLGHANRNEVAIYEKAIMDDNPERAEKTVQHETSHVAQIKDADTTLSRETVQTCLVNYVQPAEDFDFYREKIHVEKEVNVIADVATENMTRAIADMEQTRINIFGRPRECQRAA